ncbi:hypothetical protein [Streptomyces chrestomyceticus]|uniref:hypothetical protein n=1 Tax=Streptomyces chrestomyceticus TaxID=68185 RepID=UPI0019D00CF8|nr:hypothetical protein [Streptomyces chrestomyceticus]
MKTVVVNFGGAGRSGPPRRDDLQQRTRCHRLTVMPFNAALAVDFVGRHPAVRYVNNFPDTVTTIFAGDYDEAETAQTSRPRATGEPVETAAKEVLPFLDSGIPGRRPVAVREGSAVPLAPQTSPLADARGLHDYTREVLAR